jgi:glycosyltransferase involved in cell wall biosynthesis
MEFKKLSIIIPVYNEERTIHLNLIKLKISIITVVYNNIATIEDAINSVLNQDYPNIEYIVIDGKSNDGTLDIINKYRSKIHTVISEPDLGIYDAMNKGINHSTGDIIGILNSDDLYENNTILSTIIKKFELDKNLDIIYGNLVYVKPNNTQTIVRKWKSKNYYPTYFEDGNVPPHPSLFLKSSVYKNAGNFNLKYKLAADYEYMLRIFKKFTFKIEYLDLYIVRMRLGGATNKSIKNIIKGNKEIIKAWESNSIKIPFLLMPLRLIKRLMQFL